MNRGGAARRGPARWRVPLGFCAAALFLWLARPSRPSLAWGLPLAALGLALRAWASGHIRKNDALATAGPYALTRNPLYLGSTLLAAGLAIAGAGGGWAGALPAVAAMGLFAGVYLPVIRQEEAFLAARFGATYAAYAARVPRLLPRWPSRGGPTWAAQFSAALYWRHREYQALLGWLGVVAVLLYKLHARGA